jgi:hypothetical protein
MTLAEAEESIGRRCDELQSAEEHLDFYHRSKGITPNAEMKQHMQGRSIATWLFPECSISADLTDGRVSRVSAYNFSLPLERRLGRRLGLIE